MRSAAPIALELRRSRLFALLLVVATLAALWACAGSALSLPWQLTVAAAVLALALRSEWANRGQHGLRVAIDDEGAAELHTGPGEASTLRLRHWTCLGPLVTLHLAGQGTRRALFLLPDSTDAESLRRLRVRLRQLGAPAREPVG